MNRVIVRLDKFWLEIDLSTGIFIRKVFVECIANRAKHAFHDRTFHVAVSAHLKPNAAFALLNVLKMFI